MKTNKTALVCLLLLSLSVQPVFAIFAQQNTGDGQVVAVKPEKMPALGLLQGRIYDPKLGRFLSADVVVQAPENLQAYNRYSYVLNRPLSLTDPSGFTYQLYQEQAQRELRLHARELGIEKQFDAARTKAAVTFTVGFAATLASAGTLELALPALGTTVVGRMLIAEVSGALGGAASNTTDNAMSGQPLGENNSIAMTVGAVSGIVTQGVLEALPQSSNATAASTASSRGAAASGEPTPATAPVQANAITPKPVEPSSTAVTAENAPVQGPPTATTRVSNRPGNQESVTLQYPDGRMTDINTTRVKMDVPRTDAKAEPGQLRPVKFEDPIPNSKGDKRLPTPEELEILKNRPPPKSN